MALALKILLGLYILQALIKFINLFAIPYDIRIERIAAYHHSQASKVFDHILLTLMAVLVALLAAVGLEHLSFITGLLVGLTLTQVLFHRFTQPLAPDRAPRHRSRRSRPCRTPSRPTHGLPGGSSPSRPHCSSGLWWR
ncbi:hypothetical protein [Nonomuraea recticatena]|uniref:hypothetical protein n=1 Tax=Nonomuraea recticatena TaxID=46178 RepID=UPI0036127327